MPSTPTQVRFAELVASLAVAQDRLAEKSLARELGARTAEFRPVDRLADL